MRKPATAARSPPRQRQRPTPSGRGTLVPGWVRSAVLVWSAEVAAVGWCETAADNQSEAKLSGERIGRFALGQQQRGCGVHGQQRCDDRDAHARLRHPPHRASRRDDRDAAAVRSAMLQQSTVQRCNSQDATQSDSAVQSDRRTALCASSAAPATTYRHPNRIGALLLHCGCERPLRASSAAW